MNLDTGPQRQWKPNVSIHYAEGRIITRSREASRPRNWVFWWLYLGSAAAKVLVKFQSNSKRLNLTRSYGKTAIRLVNRGPVVSFQ